MWVAGVMQGLMWRAVNDDGTLTYNFIETVEAMYPFYVIRFIGGVIYVAGMLIMIYNLWRTCAGHKPVIAEVPAPVAAHA